MPDLAARARHNVTRRQVLQGALTAAGLALVGDRLVELGGPVRPVRPIRSFAPTPAGRVRRFRSRPDLRPPTVTATFAGGPPGLERPDQDDPSGYLFLGPGPVSLSGSQQYGPLIVDRRGEPVYFRPLRSGIEVTNFTATTYRGEPVLMWWQGSIQGSGYGHGEAVIVDRSYREVARVRAARGRSMDLHALWLTPEGTLLFTCYPEIVETDTSAVGGPRRAPVYQSIIQEVDVASGRLLFEWRSLAHIPVGDSYMPVENPALHQGPSLKWPYDYLHVNSIGPTPDGHLLVSGRLTWALYKLERRSGRVIWTLGGKRGDFRMSSGSQFTWQHDGRQVSPGLFTVFDNGSDGYENTEKQSRGLLLDVDETRKVVSLRRAFTVPGRLARSMGSVQILPSGRVIVGWGTAPHTTEFDAGGNVLLDVGLPSGMYSYRGLWSSWAGLPHHPPAVSAARDADTGAKLVYASWNGATGVAGWRVDAGYRGDGLHPVGIARRRGFETVVPLRADFRFAAVNAVDRLGKVLGRSHTIRI
jgi:hypothetical protein